MSEFLTAKEVAERLRISLAMVYLLCAQGKLPHLRLGLRRGTIRVRECDLAAFVEECRTKHPTNAAGLKHIKPSS